ncbi:adenosine deaminase 2-A isoform X1 [Alosa sapidissima]|uniref:adenosine deaminase 2-A isoform X1 n=1 Tax=Alosa sapidissima TaxID=34773 RepID=UPI001C0A1286|nr:adenosine deaminase 2-A isoform X1 [Alosa sapidissima]XP_041935214.1 adenosine deaminase 2-A isoform X1 [Alosa sapidissima]XP_041935215.1 adenosine deaminase 2-A isoform X1 [Alosa sapidissima]
MAFGILRLPLFSLMALALMNPCTGAPDTRQREMLMRQEASRQTGGSVVLTPAELQVDAYLHKLKVKEMASVPFPPSIHFFKARPRIQKSPVFKLLQKMPKGAALHVHSTAMVSPEWLVRNVTYRPNCYICFTWGGSVRFLFSDGQPYPQWDCLYWQLLQSLRARMVDPAKFDKSLIQNLTLFTEDPESAYPSDDAVWARFEDAFRIISGLVTYAAVFMDYLYQSLEEFYADNVMYVEIRSGLTRTYELDGSIHDKIWSLKAYRDVSAKFSTKHPDFLGLRIILSTHRIQRVSTIKAAIKEAIEMQKNFPELIAGFDLVGREDDGRPLWYFREALSLPAELGVKLPYYFHAGETVCVCVCVCKDLEGTDVDANLIDALLFNTSRIGHGYALPHHPLIKELSRKNGVAVEVCPISNQVLRLVSDFRHHPAAVLMTEGYPVVISSDDPTLFGNPGLSYDFYEAFVGIGGMRANLGTLKELAMNSIKYSSLSPHLKKKLMNMWQDKWKKFISNQKD